MSFSDTQCLFIVVALLVQMISKGSLLLYNIVILRWPVGLRWSGRNEGATYGLFRAMSPKLGQ